MRAYLKILKCPKTIQSKIKTRIVHPQPPPIFLAPHPATNARNSLLTIILHFIQTGIIELHLKLNS